MMNHADSNLSESEFLSPREFALSKGLALSTVRRYLKSGSLPCIQPGGFRCRILIPRNALNSSGKIPSENSPPAPPRAKKPQTKTSGPEPAWKKKHKIRKSEK